MSTNTADDAVLTWLLDTDPALRWQVERDLLGAPEPQWRATRARLSTEGMVARLLALQDADGQWAGGAYFPTRRDPRALHRPEDDTDARAQPWTATHHTLLLLRHWGLDASALAGTAERLAAHSRWEYENLPYWGGEVDCCINAGTLATGAWLGADVESLVAWFHEHEMPEGGWNCEWVNGSRRASVHPTLTAAREILWWEQHTGREDLRAARLRAQEYLLERHLLDRVSTGERLGPWVTWDAYPFRWPYTSIAALDHLRAAALHDGVAPDPRAAQAVELLAARAVEGRWLQGGRLPGEVWFDVDVPEGDPSPWLTLIARRVLEWWR